MIRETEKDQDLKSVSQMFQQTFITYGHTLWNFSEHLMYRFGVGS